jgi:hypothetical protein
MSTILVDRIQPYQSASVTIEGFSAPNLATTGSNTFTGDQNIQGTITASIAEGFALVGGVGNVSTLVATSSFGSGGSGFPFTGDAEITGSLTVSGSSAVDLNVVGAIQVTGSAASIRSTISNQQIILANNTTSTRSFPTSIQDGFFNNTNPTNAQLLIGVFDEPGFVNDVEFNIQVTSGSGIEFRDWDNVNTLALQTWMSIAPNLGNNPDVEFKRSVQVSGSLTISGSANNDLVVQGRQLITGPATGQTPQLLISSSNASTTIGSRINQVGKPGFDYPIFLYTYTDQSSSALFTYTDNLSATASFNLGVFDNAFTQDVELFIDTTTTNGVQFKDIRSDNGAYTTFLKIAPNGGTNPPLEFKRSAEVTGSVSISDVLQLAQKDPLPTGAVGQLAVSASNLYYHNGSSWSQIN